MTAKAFREGPGEPDDALYGILEPARTDTLLDELRGPRPDTASPPDVMPDVPDDST